MPKYLYRFSRKIYVEIRKWDVKGGSCAVRIPIWNVNSRVFELVSQIHLSVWLYFECVTKRECRFLIFILLHLLLLILPDGRRMLFSAIFIYIERISVVHGMIYEFVFNCDWASMIQCTISIVIFLIFISIAIVKIGYSYARIIFAKSNSRLIIIWWCARRILKTKIKEHSSSVLNNLHLSWI